MKQTRLQDLVKELELLREYDNLDTQTLNVVLWIVSEHLICEESYNLGMRLKERTMRYDELKKATGDMMDLHAKMQIEIHELKHNSMTPKEKAQELFNRFYDLQDAEDLGSEQLNNDMEALYEERGEEMEPYWVELAKNSALETTNVILEDTKEDHPYMYEWYLEVKQEIKKL